MFITGEYNWGIQPGLKNLTDHFLEEWFWRPAAIASYSAGRLSGARAATAWHGTLSEMGMVVISSTIAVGPIAQTLSAEGKPTGEGGKALERAFPRFADDLAWWIEAARAQRARKAAAVLRAGDSEPRASGAMLGVPFRTRTAHVMALGPVAVKSAVDQAMPPRYDPVEAAEQRHGDLCGAHDTLNAACRERTRTGLQKSLRRNRR